MIQESIAVLLVGVILLVVFIRSKHYGYALGVSPLLVLPVFHLLIRGILLATGGRFFGLRQAVVVAFVDVLAIAVTCAFIAIIGGRIQSKTNKGLYIAMMMVYSILLGWAFAFNTLKPLLP